MSDETLEKRSIDLLDDRYHFDVRDIDCVKRRLKQRHIQMIAIAGTIGTGLFLGSGQTLHVAGPFGSLLIYLLMGTVAYASLYAVAEMTTWAPISGTFPHFAARWVDPALGFAVGWNYVYSFAITTPVEVTAAVILLTYWDPNMSTATMAGITFTFCITLILVNIFGLRFFGESEFVFSLIKFALIIGLLIAGLAIDLGAGSTGDRIGFRYWKDPGLFARAGLSTNLPADRFIGVVSGLLHASFSFQGMELVVIAASETISPRHNIPIAVKRLFSRIIIFYILGIIVIGMLVPWNDDALLQSTGTAAQSPFVIAFTRSGVKTVPHLVNAAILTSALSAGNSYLFASSRVLYGLALRGQAPKFLAKCTNTGVPIVSILASGAFVFLSMMSVNAGSETVFNWLVHLCATGGFFGWLSMNLTYIHFRRGLLAQGYEPRHNAFHSRLQPYLAYWGLSWAVIFLLINGFTVFFKVNWKVADFLSSYLNSVVFLALYLGYKFWKKSKVWKPYEMDFVTGIPRADETEIEEAPPRNLWEKLTSKIF